MATYQSKLTKKEKKHLRYALHGYVTLRGFEELRAIQRASRAEGDAKGYGPGIAEPCFKCKAIARKLGLE